MQQLPQDTPEDISRMRDNPIWRKMHEEILTLKMANKMSTFNLPCPQPYQPRNDGPVEVRQPCP